MGVRIDLLSDNIQKIEYETKFFLQKKEKYILKQTRTTPYNDLSCTMQIKTKRVRH